MDSIPKAVAEALPKVVSTGIGWALAAMTLVEGLRTLKKEGVGKLVGRDAVRKVRVFCWGLMIFFVIQGLRAADGQQVMFVAFAAIDAVYLLAEGGLAFWLYWFRRRHTLLSAAYRRSCREIIHKRQRLEKEPKSDFGGFDAKSDRNDRIELWSTAQSLHAIASINSSATAAAVLRALTYYEAKLPVEDTYWRPGKGVLVTPASWVLLSLAAVARGPNYKAALEVHPTRISDWLNVGAKRLVALRTGDGAWTPAGSHDALDGRTLPTIVSLWALAEVVAVRDKASLQEDTLSEIAVALRDGCTFLLTSLQNEQDEKYWDANPKRPWRKKCSALTLFTFAALLSLVDTLSEEGPIGMQDQVTKLRGWAKKERDAIMRHIDHCLHRGLDDNEADAPWDNLVKDETEASLKDFPVTYFDWPTSALFALQQCKKVDMYDHADAVREQRLTTQLTNAEDQLERQYTFRLAMILISSQPTSGS